MFTSIFRFKSLASGKPYIIRAEYHEENVFAVKFYLQQHSGCEYRYGHVTNFGDARKILMTIASLLPYLLERHPGASFAFIGAQTWDKERKRVEPMANNQRFRIYRGLVDRVVGRETFELFASEKLSGHLLVNRSAGDVESRKDAILKMFNRIYYVLDEAA